MSRLYLILALICLIRAATSLSIDVAPHSQECFFENLNEGDKMTISYQVSEDSSREIDFKVYGPGSREMLSANGKTSDIHVFSASSTGKYEYCFINTVSSTAVSVGFNAHDMLKIKQSATEQIDPIENEIRELADSIFSIKSEQEYIVIRERQHRNTAESTNSRVKWWSIGQLIMLVAVCFWQVFYLKRFFEVKRVV
ncbi:p24 complex component [Apophysomyces sp. BC1034]|nr:p24 complex component [Apophysomyces sp. BC1015]KAG0179253.1 p24 complex component [Apophysomyces sp. BC1021]KAG0192432.1 p24 complex component [Apophysomyces sp. BC1034]